MIVSLAALALLATTGAAPDTATYYALTVQGKAVGYSTVEETTATLDGKPARRTTVHIVDLMNYGGKRLEMRTDTVVWNDLDGRPLRIASSTVTPVTRTRLSATLGPKTAEIDVTVDGKKVHRSLPMPDGPIGDVIQKSVRDRLRPGGTVVYWSLDSEGSGFNRRELKEIGPTTVDQDGKATPARLSELTTDGATVRVYTTPDGELLRQEYPGAVVVARVAKATALALTKEGARTEVLDLGHLQADHPLGDTESVYGLTLRIAGDDLSKAPSDEFQTVTKDGDGWLVKVHPPLMQLRANAPLAGVAKGEEEWTKPAPGLDSDDPKIKALAAELVKGQGDRLQAAVEAIRRFVQEKMTYEIGFVKPRSAAEILRDPKGKCTDYAILTTALLRAAGIPSRLAAGLVGDDDGGFDYHAWSEAWDGERWIGVDPLTRFDQVTASCVKLAQGNVEEAFGFPPPADPSAVKIQVRRIEPMNRTPITYDAGR